MINGSTTKTEEKLRGFQRYVILNFEIRQAPCQTWNKSANNHLSQNEHMAKTEINTQHLLLLVSKI